MVREYIKRTGLLAQHAVAIDMGTTSTASGLQSYTIGAGVSNEW
jgi:hypothetical protein